MARQRRGGGFKPPELRGTLGTLLRTAAAQVGPLRDALGDALERTAREGRSRIDDARSRFDETRTSRRRTDALADLGEIVLDLIRRGEIDLAELPEVRDLVAHLDEIDDADADDETLRHLGNDDEPPAHPPALNRFDSRGRDPSPSRRSPAGDDDGTASSRTWSPPSRPAQPAARVWRPPVDDDAPPVVEPAARRRPPLPRQGEPARKGGISFEDDDDLAEYMHPDDVPAKKPPDSDP
jgi:hypothetical protein